MYRIVNEELALSNHVLSISCQCILQFLVRPRSLATRIVKLCSFITYCICSSVFVVITIAQ